MKMNKNTQRALKRKKENKQQNHFNKHRVDLHIMEAENIHHTTHHQFQPNRGARH